MSSFLGIPLPLTLGQELAEAGAEFASLRVQKPENMHLTIRFLGNVVSMDPVIDAVAPVAAAHQPFNMILKGLGAFPDIDNARVLWVGLDRGDMQAGALAKGVENALSGIGFERERRPFRGHITLGRFPKPATIQLPHGHSFGAVRADRLVLYRSVVTEHGSEYEVVKEMSLGAGMTPGPD